MYFTFYHDMYNLTIINIINFLDNWPEDGDGDDDDDEVNNNVD